MIQCPHCQKLIPTLKTMLPEERFWYYVQKTDTCWNWIGNQSRGYGIFAAYGGGKYQPAHRYSYELHKGPISDGLFVCHTCDNRQCVNPDHLFLGTLQDNVDDMWSKDRGKRGENHPSSYLKEKDILSIRQLYSTGSFSYKQLAEKFNSTMGTIRDCIKNYTWSHLPTETPINKKNKLTENDVKEIRKLKLEGNSFQELSNKFNVSTRTIRKIISGETWKNII